jgi:WD40 repeat protein
MATRQVEGPQRRDLGPHPTLPGLNAFSGLWSDDDSSDGAPDWWDDDPSANSSLIESVQAHEEDIDEPSIDGLMAGFDIDEYEIETDFLFFLYQLSQEGVIKYTYYENIARRRTPPLEITPEWLEHNPEYDNQGINWFQRIPKSRRSFYRTLSSSGLDNTTLSANTSRTNSSISLTSINDTPSTSGTNNSKRITTTPASGWEHTKVRFLRLKTYRGYHDVCEARKSVLQEIDTKVNLAPYFDFKCTFTTPRPHLVHFQLRNVVCPVSKNDVYVSEWKNDFFVIRRLNPETGIMEDALGAQYMGSNLALSTMVSALAANDEYVVVGGFHGQYICKRIDRIGESDGISEGYVTTDSNGITNHVSLLGRNTLTPGRVVFSSNDCYLRTLDIETGSMVHQYHYPWAINCSSYCPSNSRMRVLVGDSTEGFIVDSQTDERIATLRGHYDYGFACCWSPDGHTIATGNQDGSCRIYDSRNTTRPVHVIGTQLLGAIRSMSFDSSGRFLAFSEPIDYVTVLDSQKDFSTGQIISLWGDIGGLGFVDGAYGDGQILTIGNCDNSVGGIVQYERNSYNRFLCDDLFI